MQPRMQLETIDPTAYKNMMGLEKYLQQTSLDTTLIHLIKVRASQLNRCAFCIVLHTTLARQHGETEQRLKALSAWQETPFFTPAERAALALTDAVTQIAQAGVPDKVYEEVSHHFSEVEIAQLLMVLVTINAWNRIAITTQLVPGQIPAGVGL